MKGFWKSKTTWIALGTVLTHIGAILMHGLPTGTSVMTMVVSVLAVCLRDALRSHAKVITDIMAQVVAASGVGVPLAAPGSDGGEVG